MNLFLTKIPLFPIWPKLININGVKIAVRNSPLNSQMRRHLMKGRYEAAERELATTFIRPGDQILELGASVGIVTCFLARAAGERGRVVSVEPNSQLKSYFQRQLLLNGIRAELIHALCCPLWKQQIPEKLASQSFLASRSTLSGRTARPGETGISVRWLTAEEVCRQTSLEPTVLVADIEGTEVVWTEHPPNFPRSLRTVLIELHTHIVGTKSAGQIVQVVMSEGFRLAGVQRNVFAFERT
jgi:FkbM family methyltransferase